MAECRKEGELLPTQDVHIMTPAGGGKTFIAMHLMLDALLHDLELSIRILFVAQNTPLAYSIAKWLWERVQDEKRKK
jgi:ERCC4-related helicase